MMEKAAQERTFIQMALSVRRGKSLILGFVQAVAYWMPGSLADSDAIDNLGGWLTTVVCRVCLDMLWVRTARREDQLEPHLSDLAISAEDGGDPGQLKSVASFTIAAGKIVAIDILSDPDRIAQLDISGRYLCTESRM